MKRSVSTKESQTKRESRLGKEREPDFRGSTVISYDINSPNILWEVIYSRSLKIKRRLFVIILQLVLLYVTRSNRK